MSTTVRAGAVDDVERCVELWTRVITARDGVGAVAEVADWARAAFTRPVLRFAIIGPTRTGFALTVTKDQHVALLSRICVDPTATSQGLGAVLLADAIEHARGAAYRRIDLNVRQRNTRAIAVYVRTGFHPSSDPWRVDDGDLVVTWSRHLVDPGPH